MLTKEQRALTEKQRAFVKAYWEVKNATEAYAIVYNKKNQMSRATCAVNAHRMLDDPRFIAELDKYKAAQTNRAPITLEDSIAAQSFAMELAAKAGNSAAYSQAALNRAKLLGQLTDKVESRTTVIQEPADVRPDLAVIWRRSDLPELKVIDCPVLTDQTVDELKH